jgi:hypothetical protein
MLNKIEYRVEDKYIVFDPFNRKKIKDPCIVLRDERVSYS